MEDKKLESDKEKIEKWEEEGNTLKMEEFITSINKRRQRKLYKNRRFIRRRDLRKKPFPHFQGKKDRVGMERNSPFALETDLLVIEYKTPSLFLENNVGT